MPLTVVTPPVEGVDMTPWITPITIIALTVVVLVAVLMYLFCNAQRKVELSNLAITVNRSVPKNTNCL